MILYHLFFILAMNQIFRVHDPSPTGVTVGNYLHVGVLGYADDAAIASKGVDLLPHGKAWKYPRRLRSWLMRT